MSLMNSTKTAWELNASGKDLCRERARDRTSSRACQRRAEDSFGKHLLSTAAMKIEIARSSHFSSPPSELLIILRRDWAAALPGDEEPRKRARDGILALCPAATRGGRKKPGPRLPKVATVGADPSAPPKTPSGAASVTGSS